MHPYFPGYSQSDESGDGPEDEPAAREQTEHVERGPADEQAQPSKHTQVSPNPVHFCTERNSTDEQIISLLYTCRIFSVVSQKKKKPEIRRNYRYTRSSNDYI